MGLGPISIERPAAFPRLRRLPQLLSLLRAVVFGASYRGMRI